MMETSSVIVLDSDSDDGVVNENDSLVARKRKAPTPPSSKTAPLNGTNVDTNVTGSAEPPQRKRIKPITIASNLSERWPDGGTPPHNNNNIQPAISSDHFAPITYSEDWEHEIKRYRAISMQAVPTTPASSRSSTTNDESESNNPSASEGTVKALAANQPPSQRKASSLTEKNQIGKEFQELLDACRKADNSKDMETLIEKKLVRYYEVVHPDYVNSKSFKKAVVQVTTEVKAHPNLVFLKIASIVEELNIRRKSRPVVAPSTIEADDPAPPPEDSGTSKKDRQIRKLNRTLYILDKRIKQMEEAEVDFNHESNSTYLMAERYKKRAFEVYEKLCDITGESKNAHRLVRKPIQFQGTSFTEFNRMLSQFVNRKNSFPNFRDVLKCLLHCNTKYDYGLQTEQMNRMAHEAFSKIGKLLQKRRKTDLYETVVYHTGDEKDPATIDPKLREKLEENGKHYGKVNQLIEKFAAKESMIREEIAANKSKTEDTTATEESRKGGIKSSDSVPSSSASSSKATTSTASDEAINEISLEVTDSDDDDDDEDDDEDEEDEFESTTKENVQPDSFEDVVISDDDELVVLDS
ncbi:daxx-like protein [Anopheles nili]|uniref:daxx-like protein n=1 Tax=Anopheles nili TaxID=185578 RepID=UPI00237BACD0|nr:daxx-like protein [Anopheles nili]